MVSPRRTGLRPRLLTSAGLARVEVLLALVAFAVLCVAALRPAPRLVEPDDFAYRASIVAATDGHLLTLSAAQVHALTTQLGQEPGGPGRLGPGGTLGPGGPPPQWVELPDGRWISEKDPGYPYLAAPFQWLGLIRLTPLFYGALGCLGLFFGARRWLGRFGGFAAVGLYCSSGAALLFAWRDYMPTFTDASLIAAGTGVLLWAVLAAEAGTRRRTWAGLAGFVALEAAAFTRYTDIVVLGCAVVAVLLAGWRRTVPRSAVAWWLGSAVVFVVGVAVFDDLVYGAPLSSGYRPGEISFSLGAIGPNLRYLPGHLVEAMPLLVLALVGVAGIIIRWILARHDSGGPELVRRDLAVGRELAGRGTVGGRDLAGRDLAVGLALFACWLGVWGLYATYTWTAAPGLVALQDVRFYVPGLAAMSLLGAWLLVRVPSMSESPNRPEARPPDVAGAEAVPAEPVPHRTRTSPSAISRAAVAGVTSVAVVAAAFGLGLASYNNMRPSLNVIPRVGPPSPMRSAQPAPGPPGHFHTAQHG
jgi:hypothetical protein